jgi:hypothetical protein
MTPELATFCSQAGVSPQGEPAEDTVSGCSRRSALRMLGTGLITSVTLGGSRFSQAEARGKVVKRSFAELLAAQGSTADFDPPFPDHNGWSTPLSAPAHFAYVDYPGVIAKYLATNHGINLGTKVHGSVFQRNLDDGRAEVTMLMQTTKALTWIVKLDEDLVTGPLDFGYRPAELVANPSLRASLATSILKQVFFLPTHTSPLPDLGLLSYGDPPPGQHRSYDFRAWATGTLREAFGVPDGTPGIAKIVNVGITLDKPGGCGDECYPVEIIEMKATGGPLAAINVAAAEDPGKHRRRAGKHGGRRRGQGKRGR